jgi:pyruvate,water dikinase
MGYFFRQRIDRFYDSITGQDLVDMVYSRSLMTEEREKLYQMVELIQADPELCELFQEFKHDHIISARLARFQSDPACELRQMIEEYSRAYGWIYTEDLMDGVLPHPGSVSLVECVHRIRRFLHISIPEYRTNLQKMGENAARLRTKGFENCTSPEDRAALEMALKAGEKAFLAGDNHTFFICSRKYVYISDALIRTASVLAANDQINNLDDIRFLTLEEVKNALLEGSRFHDKVSERQKEYQKWSMRLPPERIGGGEPHSAETPEKQETRETPLIIKGESGTRKNVRGRIYLGFPSQPTEDDLILVLEHGHEGDLTTILHHVVGLIVKMGSPASHMGIIARELGIPAIYGVGEDISIMKSGDIVELHGQTGEIVLQNM